MQLLYSHSRQSSDLYLLTFELIALVIYVRARMLTLVIWQSWSACMHGDIPSLIALITQRLPDEWVWTQLWRTCVRKTKDSSGCLTNIPCLSESGYDVSSVGTRTYTCEWHRANKPHCGGVVLDTANMKLIPSFPTRQHFLYLKYLLRSGFVMQW